MIINYLQNLKITKIQTISRLFKRFLPQKTLFLDPKQQSDLLILENITNEKGRNKLFFQLIPTP